MTYTTLSRECDIFNPDNIYLRIYQMVDELGVIPSNIGSPQQDDDEDDEGELTLSQK